MWHYDISDVTALTLTSELKLCGSRSLRPGPWTSLVEPRVDEGHVTTQGEP